MDPTETLAAACRLVAHDLAATGVPDAAALAALTSARTERGWWLDAWPGGAEHVLCLVAQDVQELVKESWDPYWPPCREHRDHALVVEPELGPDPFWVCEESGLPVAAVGGL